MKHKRIVKAITNFSVPDGRSVIDSHGLLCEARVVRGELRVCGTENDTGNGRVYYADDGFSFIGRIKMMNDMGETGYLYVTLYDLV